MANQTQELLALGRTKFEIVQVTEEQVGARKVIRPASVSAQGDKFPSKRCPHYDPCPGECPGITSPYR